STAASPPQSYNGHDFAIKYPDGWTVSHLHEARNFDTTITPPGDSTLMIRVDENPNAAGLSTDAAAAPVIAALRKEPTYHEIGISHINFQGMDALQWEFEDTENGVRLHKIDLFFIDPDGHGWGILTQSPAASWAQDASPLASYQQTFQA